MWHDPQCPKCEGEWENARKSDMLPLCLGENTISMPERNVETSPSNCLPVPTTV